MMAGRPTDAQEMGAIGPEDVESCVAAASGPPGEPKDGRPPVKRRGQALAAEEGAGDESASLSTSSSVAPRSGPEVALALSKYLKIFAWVYVYCTLVELFAVVAIFLQVLPTPIK